MIRSSCSPATAAPERPPTLLRLKRELDHDVYFPVYFDVEDYFNTELPLEAGTFLVALAAGFVDNLKEVDGLKQKPV